MKKVLFLLFGIIMVVSLAACSSDDNASGKDDNSESGKDEDITLRMAWWGDQPRNDYTNEVIKMYEEQNPGITIEAEYASWDDYWQKLAPQAAANELPDIIQMDLSYLAQYAQNNQLADLTPFLEDQIDVSNINENIVSDRKSVV